MPLRLCSMMGTLVLALAVASPALAAKKKKKASAEVSTSEDKGDAKKKGKSDDVSEAGGDNLDSLMSRGGNKDKNKDKKAPSAEEGAADPQKQESASDSASWEQPPMEQEKPIGPAPKLMAKPVGDGRHWSAGLLLGWAFKTDRSTAQLGADPYGLGFGIRGGYSFDFKLYVGVFYVYYLGSTETGNAARIALATKSSSANYMQFGVEAGYDLWAGPVIVRPSLEIGPAVAITDVTGSTMSVTRLLLAPGFTVMYPVEGFFIGGEARANLIPSNNGVSAVMLAATGGLRFE